jgi:hypothetical protein
MVVTGADRCERRKKVQSGNREWATVINYISNDDYSLSLFLFLKGAIYIIN